MRQGGEKPLLFDVEVRMVFSVRARSVIIIGITKHGTVEKELGANLVTVYAQNMNPDSPDSGSGTLPTWVASIAH